MGIGVEEAKAHQLLEVTGGTNFRDLCRVDPGFQQGWSIVDFDAWEVIQTQHPTATQFPNHARNTNAGLIQKLLPEASGVLRLHAEIKLPQQHPSTFLSHRHPITSAAPAGMTLQHGRHLLHHLQIQAEHPFQTGTLDLEHHLTTTAQAGSMHLRQGRSTQGLRVEVNDLGTALPQLLFQHRLGTIKREGRHLVLQVGQLGNPPRRQHIRPGREQLAQLDEGRAERQQLSGEPTGTPLLTTRFSLWSASPRIGPLAGIPPEVGDQGENGTPDAQRPDSTS